MTPTTKPEEKRPGKPREQRLVIYHPNSAGTGSALQLEPRINRSETDRYNCFFLEMAAQKTAASSQGGKRSFATFDWEHKLIVKLDFNDICELLAVLEGRAEKVGGQRNGLFHENGKACTIITFQKKPDKNGYFLGLSKKDRASEQLSRVHMILSETEAIGLRSLMQSGLFFITFHNHLFPSAGRTGGDTMSD
jgi:hypothetical protein